MHMTYTKYNFFNVNIKKIKPKTLTFLSFACEVYKKIVHIHILVTLYLYMYIESLIIDFVILHKAKIMSLH